MTTKKMGCKFCETLSEHKAIPISPGFEYRYGVALVYEIYRVGELCSRGRSTNYGSGEFALNYCPMCGKTLKDDA